MITRQVTCGASGEMSDLVAAIVATGRSLRQEEKKLFRLQNQTAAPVVGHLMAEVPPEEQGTKEAFQKLWPQALSIIGKALAGGDRDEVLALAAGQGLPELLCLSLASSWEALQPLGRFHADLIKRLEALARKLPCYPRARLLSGLAEKGLGRIVAEAGDIGMYANPAKLWKRFGMHVVDGVAAKHVKGEGSGFSSPRRAIIWAIAASQVRLVKHKGKVVERDEAGLPLPGGPYRLLYTDRKAYELARGLKKSHAHMRAVRYVAKRILRDVWRIWHGQEVRYENFDVAIEGSEFTWSGLMDAFEEGGPDDGQEEAA